ncbi:MAG TPA: MgtC/SapB family protein [Vicinamibacterales bacterium]|nr:MgtC/SapB family protein [Vicinamibacterales bacterium]
MADLRMMEDWASLDDVLLPFLVRCGAAALCGAMIGLERELRRKPAGFRTNILICVGSAMYMTIGLLLVRDVGAVTDPTRIAAQVVTGIGFLGAGSILQSGQRVTGLTTAATIWVVAAIGIIAGAGFPVLAFVASCLVLLTLIVLGRFENRYLDQGQADDTVEKR